MCGVVRLNLGSVALHASVLTRGVAEFRMRVTLVTLHNLEEGAFGNDQQVVLKVSAFLKRVLLPGMTSGAGGRRDQGRDKDVRSDQALMLSGHR